MKKLKYGYAVVSFCPDLTSPTAESIPLAGLLVGEIEDEAVAAVAWLEVPDRAFEGDPLAAAIMHDLPHVLKSQVEDAWEQIVARKLGSDSLLAELHNSLRNTLHVSEMSGTTVTDVEENQDVPGILVGEISRRLTDVVQRYRDELARMEKPKPRRADRPALVMEPTERPPAGAEFFRLRAKPKSADECYAE